MLDEQPIIDLQSILTHQDMQLGQKTPQLKKSLLPLFPPVRKIISCKKSLTGWTDIVMKTPNCQLPPLSVPVEDTELLFTLLTPQMKNIIAMSLCQRSENWSRASVRLWHTQQSDHREQNHEGWQVDKQRRCFPLIIHEN